MKQTGNRFDIRHKETLTLFLREYFDLFFPDITDKIDFEHAEFLDKELVALFGEAGEKLSADDQQRITDALILVEAKIEGEQEQILIHWEQQSEKQKNFEKRMFHYFCGIYFKFRKPVFPIAMFTDSAKWKEQINDKYSFSLFGYKINEFKYNLIKLKHIQAEEFEKKAAENPLAAAYLPLTDYPKKDRPLIKAKALNNIAKVTPGPKRSILYSLIDQSVKLNPDEEKSFRELVIKNPMFQEAKMLQSIEEVGIEKGIEKGIEVGIEKGIEVGIEKGIEVGIEKGIEKGRIIGRKEGEINKAEDTAIKLLHSRWLNKEQISEVTGLDKEKLDELEKKLKAE